MKKWYCYDENGGIVYRPYDEDRFKELVGRYCRLKQNTEIIYLHRNGESLCSSSKYFAEGSLCIIREIRKGVIKDTDTAVIEILEHKYDEPCFLEQNALNFNLFIKLLVREWRT